MTIPAWLLKRPDPRPVVSPKAACRLYGHHVYGPWKRIPTNGGVQDHREPHISKCVGCGKARYEWRREA